MTLSDVARTSECRLLMSQPGSPGPVSALGVTARAAGWLCGRTGRVSQGWPAAPVTSRDQLRDTGDTRHWPAPAGPGAGRLRLLCSSQSLPASRDLVTLVTGHTGHTRPYLTHPGHHHHHHQTMSAFSSIAKMSKISLCCHNSIESKLH